MLFTLTVLASFLHGAVEGVADCHSYDVPSACVADSTCTWYVPYSGVSSGSFSDGSVYWGMPNDFGILGTCGACWSVTDFPSDVEDQSQPWDNGYPVMEVSECSDLATNFPRNFYCDSTAVPSWANTQCASSTDYHSADISGCMSAECSAYATTTATDTLAAIVTWAQTQTDYGNYPYLYWANGYCGSNDCADAYALLECLYLGDAPCGTPDAQQFVVWSYDDLYTPTAKSYWGNNGEDSPSSWMGYFEDCVSTCTTELSTCLLSNDVACYRDFAGAMSMNGCSYSGLPCVLGSSYDWNSKAYDFSVSELCDGTTDLYCGTEFQSLWTCEWDCAVSNHYDDATSCLEQGKVWQTNMCPYTGVNHNSCGYCSDVWYNTDSGETYTCEYMQTSFEYNYWCDINDVPTYMQDNCDATGQLYEDGADECREHYCPDEQTAFIEWENFAEFQTNINWDNNSDVFCDIHTLCDDQSWDCTIPWAYLTCIISGAGSGCDTDYDSNQGYICYEEEPYKDDNNDTQYNTQSCNSCASEGDDSWACSFAGYCSYSDSSDDTGEECLTVTCIDEYQACLVTDSSCDCTSDFSKVFCDADDDGCLNIFENDGFMTPQSVTDTVQAYCSSGDLVCNDYFNAMVTCQFDCYFAADCAWSTCETELYACADDATCLEGIGGIDAIFEEYGDMEQYMFDPVFEWFCTTMEADGTYTCPPELDTAAACYSGACLTDDDCFSLSCTEYADACLADTAVGGCASLVFEIFAWNQGCYYDGTELVADAEYATTYDYTCIDYKASGADDIFQYLCWQEGETRCTDDFKSAIACMLLNCDDSDDDWMKECGVTCYTDIAGCLLDSNCYFTLMEPSADVPIFWTDVYAPLYTAWLLDLTDGVRSVAYSEWWTDTVLEEYCAYSAVDCDTILLAALSCIKPCFTFGECAVNSCPNSFEACSLSQSSWSRFAEFENFGESYDSFKLYYEDYCGDNDCDDDLKFISECYMDECAGEVPEFDVTVFDVDAVTVDWCAFIKIEAEATYDISAEICTDNCFNLWDKPSFCHSATWLYVFYNYLIIVDNYDCIDYDDISIYFDSSTCSYADEDVFTIAGINAYIMVETSDCYATIAADAATWADRFGDTFGGVGWSLTYELDITSNADDAVCSLITATSAPDPDGTDDEETGDDYGDDAQHVSTVMAFAFAAFFTAVTAL